MDEIETLKQWVESSRNIVFFGGAGVSTESGIPDFRSVDGLYSQKFDYPPETIISHSFFLKKPEYFFRFYKEKMLDLTGMQTAEQLYSILNVETEMLAPEEQLLAVAYK